MSQTVAEVTNSGIWRNKAGSSVTKCVPPNGLHPPLMIMSQYNSILYKKGGTIPRKQGTKWWHFFVFQKKSSSYISSRKATWFPYFLAAVTTCSRNNLKSQASRHDTTPLSSRFIRTSFTTTLGRGGGGIETKCILKLSDKIALRKSPFLLSVVLFSR